MAEVINITNDVKPKKQPVKIKVLKQNKLKFKTQENKVLKSFLQKEELHELKEEIENKKEITSGFKEVILNCLSIPIKKEKQKDLYIELKNNKQINKTLDNKLSGSLFSRLNENMLFICNYGLAYNNALNGVVREIKEDS